MSDPQLRKDIAALTLNNAALKKRILELESQHPEEVVKTVIKEVIVKEPRDKAKEDDLRAEVDRLRREISGGPKTVIKEVSGPVEIKRVEVPVVKYVKCPKQAALIRELRAKIKAG